MQYLNREGFEAFILSLKTYLKSEHDSVDTRIEAMSDNLEWLFDNNTAKTLFNSISIATTDADATITLKVKDPKTGVTEDKTITIPIASATKAGLLSAVDKTKLDQLPSSGKVVTEVGAPATTETTITQDISYSAGVADVRRTFPSATSTAAGLMSKVDKVEHDRISTSNFGVVNNAADVAVKAESDSVDRNLVVPIHYEYTDIATGTSYSKKAIIPECTETKAGVVSGTDKSFINGIRGGNKALVPVAITGTWKFYNNAGTEIAANTISPVPNAVNPVLENGYKASFTGTYKWSSATGKKDPTMVNAGVTSGTVWDTLPASGVASASYAPGIVAANTTYKVQIEAPKTGLMVSGSNVVPAAGNDAQSATVSVAFKHRMYTGYITAAATEASIKALASTLVTKPEQVQPMLVNATDSQYFVIAYPSNGNDLNNKNGMNGLTFVTQDGSLPAIGAFTETSLNITNNAGLPVVLRVYTSNNKGAFKNKNLTWG